MYFIVDQASQSEARDYQSAFNGRSQLDAVIISVRNPWERTRELLFARVSSSLADFEGYLWKAVSSAAEAVEAAAHTHSTSAPSIHKEAPSQKEPQWRNSNS
jgi:hypothetical protein